MLMDRPGTYALKDFFSAPLPLLAASAPSPGQGGGMLRGCLGYESPLPSTISDAGTGSLPQCLTPVRLCGSTEPCANPGAFPHPGGYLHTSAMLLHYCNTTSYLLRGPKSLPPRCPAPPRAYSFSDGCCSDKGVACDCLSTVTARCWGGQGSASPISCRFGQ